MKTTTVKELVDRIQDNGDLPLVELHVIRSIGPTLLNRDFNNMVKKIVFGGTTRVRFSSQSVMKAIRDFRSRMKGDNTNNIHSRHLPEHLARKISDRGEEYTELAEHIRNSFAKNKKNKTGETGQILVYAEHDLDQIADIIIKRYEEDKNAFLKDENILETLRGEMAGSAFERGVDDMTALKGRMSTDLQYVVSIESAASINHGYSVDQWYGDTDFFSATDDADRMINFINGKTNDVSGSGIIEVQDVAANVFYQYANIDTRTLFENVLRGVNLEDENAVSNAIKRMHRIVSEFITDFATIVPEAKQHSMASKPLPSCMLVTAKKTARAQSADSEFVDAIEGNGSIGVSKIARDRLVSFINNAQNGAFATEEFRNIFWIEDGDNDNIPQNAKKTSLKNIEAELFE